MDKCNARNVVVTGFGPFGNHNVNESWQAVKLLSSTSSKILKQRYNVDLIIEEIPVIYNYVTDRIPKLWNEHNPLFVIHVGVSHMACCLTIEKKAHNSGYNGQDICERRLENNNDDNCNVIETEIDIENICNILNSSGICTSTISHNAGRYLCEYIYYQSLYINRNRTLFVHVPESKVCPLDTTARGLYFIICNLIEKYSKELN